MMKTIEMQYDGYKFRSNHNLGRKGNNDVLEPRLSMYYILAYVMVKHLSDAEIKAVVDKINDSVNKPDGEQTDINIFEEVIRYRSKEIRALLEGD